MVSEHKQTVRLEPYDRTYLDLSWEWLRDPEIKAEMVARANGKSTFPQIFVGDKHVGGSDDIHALDARGGLDPLLAA